MGSLARRMARSAGRRSAAAAPASAVRTAAQIQRERTVPSTGPVRLFLDDERPCPEGWTLSKTSHEFVAKLESLEDGRLDAISLDWHLGSGSADGQAVADHVAQMMRDRPAFFSELRHVGLHSSVRDRAVEMERPFYEVLRDDQERDDPLLPFFELTVGSPRLYRPKP